MTQNTRQVLLVCSVVAVMFGGMAWLIPAAKEPNIWWLRIGALVLLAWVIGFSAWAKRRRDLAPDFLAQLSANFFEQDGFAFVVGTEVLEGVGYLCVWFQNRYERPCEAMVLVRTSERWLAPQRHLPDAKVSLTCQPGAFGKALVPWPLPLELQGRKVLLDVMARRKYPRGRGKLLRRRTGLRVGSAPQSAISDALKVLGVLGGCHGGRAARTEIQLPRDVATTPLLTLQPHPETIWRFGDPTDRPTDSPATSQFLQMKRI